MSIGTPTCSICADTVDELAAIQCDRHVDVGQQQRQQPHHGVDVGRAVYQNLRDLFGGERPALEDALAHRVLALGVDGIETEIRQRAEQAFALRRKAAVHVAAKFRREIENVRRQRPAEREMAGKLRVADEADEQHLLVDAIGRPVARARRARADGLPRRPLVPCEADHVGTLSGFSDELEVGENDLLVLAEYQRSRSLECAAPVGEGTHNHGHAPPTSGTAGARGCRSDGLCRGTPDGRSWRASAQETRLAKPANRRGEGV